MPGAVIDDSLHLFNVTQAVSQPGLAGSTHQAWVWCSGCATAAAEEW